MKNKILKIVAIVALIATIAYLWFVHVNHRFMAVTPNKVYKSALIPPDELEEYLVKNKIKTVVNLIEEGKKQYIDKELQKIQEINKKDNLNIKFLHINSKQVPSKENLIEYYNVLDKKENYPVLVHCYHGLGRTELYVALYKIEYEGMSPREARDDTRIFIQNFIHKSSFADTKPKGKYLLNYIPRRDRNQTEVK